MNEAITIALKINKLLLEEPLIIEYKKLEQLIGKQIKEDDKKIRSLQKKMSENLGLIDYEKYKKEYLDAKTLFDNNPMYNNYLIIKEEVNDILNEIQKIINHGL